MQAIWYVRAPVVIFAFAGIVSSFQYNPADCKYLLMNIFCFKILWDMAKRIDVERGLL